MPLSAIDKVRSLIGDMNKVAVQENVANGDGSTTNFQLDMFPVRTGTWSIHVSGALITTASMTADIDIGRIRFNGAAGVTAPTAGAQVIANYQYNAMSDQEIQAFIDLASGGGTLKAASLAAAGLAGNYARFFAYTQGSKSVDKNELSNKLLRLSKRLDDSYEKSIGMEGIGITIATFDDSGTEFEGYDTASALLTATS